VTRPDRRTTAWGLLVLGVLLLGVGLAFGGGGSSWAVTVAQGFAFVAMGTVGAVVLSRSDATTIGWIYLGCFLGMAVFTCASAYGAWGVGTDAAGVTAAEWLGNWGWVPVFGVLVPYSLLLFPDGHLPSPRWRPVGWATAVVVVLWAAAFAFQGADYTDLSGRHVPNPYSTPTLVAVADPARVVLSFLWVALAGVGVASLVVRYRRGDETLRAQVRWLMLSGAVIVGWFALPLDHGNGGWGDVVMGLVLALLPISVGIAITRYHLYDIDRILSRTASYAIVTGALVTLYVLVVTTLPRLVPATSSSFAVAIATLAAAAAFRPLLRRVRAAVDRRFDRSRYDARVTVESFGARLRDEVDPHAVTATVRQTMQPAAVVLVLHREPSP
jgi:MFS family permease